MTMNYLQNDRNKENKLRFFRNVFILLVAAMILSIFFPNLTGSYLRKIALPVWASKERVADVGVFSRIRSKASILSENEDLKSKLVEIRLALLVNESLKKENEEMRETLDALRGKNAIWADVIARPPVSAYDTFVVKTGSTIPKVGFEALAYGTVLIGEIVEADKSTSLVRLYSASGNSYQATIEPSRETIEIKGSGAGSFESRIPKAVKVAINDKVYFLGNSKLLGTVAHIEETSSDSFKTIYIQSPINIYKLKAVQIVIEQSAVSSQ